MKFDLLLFGAVGLMLIASVFAYAENVTEPGQVACSVGNYSCTEPCKLRWFDDDENGRIDLNEVVMGMQVWKFGFIQTKCMVKVINACGDNTVVTGDN
jgi:hypothetical protein